MNVVYTDGTETLVFPKDKEEELIPLWFGREVGRDRDDYERTEYAEAIQIMAGVAVGE